MYSPFTHTFSGVQYSSLAPWSPFSTPPRAPVHSFTSVALFSSSPFLAAPSPYPSHMPWSPVPNPSPSTSFAAWSPNPSTPSPFMALTAATTTPTNTTTSPPIAHSVPPEILGEIFILSFASSLPSGYHLSRRSSMLDTERLSLRISHVCLYWRNVALSIPALWSSLAFPSLDSHAYPHSRLLWLQTLLQRSKSGPLSVYVPAGSKIGVFWLAQNIHLCSDLFIDVDHIIEEVLTLPFSSATQLSHLTIQGDKCGRRTIDQLLLLINSAPALAELDWHAYLVYRGPPQLLPLQHHQWPCSPITTRKLQWNGITRLTLGGTTYIEDCVVCLAQFPALTHLTARRLMRAPPCTPRLVCRVEALKVDVLDVYAPESDVAEVLEYLTLPALQALCIGSGAKERAYGRCGMSSVMAAVAALVARSGCGKRLKRLEICGLPEADIAACLGMGVTWLSGVEELSVTCAEKRGFGDRTVRMLEYGRWGLFPMLRRLRMGRCATGDGVLAAMVRSRVRVQEGGQGEGDGKANAKETVDDHEKETEKAPIDKGKAKVETKEVDTPHKNNKLKENTKDEPRPKGPSPPPLQAPTSLESIHVYLAPTFIPQIGYDARHDMDMKALKECQKAGLGVKVLCF